MKLPLSSPFATLLAATLVLTLAPAAHAVVVTWGGSTGEYTTGTNWVGGNVPDTGSGATAQINSGAVTYTPGGDLAIHNGGALQINGGSWTQSGGNAWIQLVGGSLLVNGGTFNQGTSGNLVLDSTSTISITAGTANFNGNFLYDPTNSGTFSLTGGTANVASEFKPISTFNMTAGTLNANLISFADGPGSINFSGGIISVNGAGAYSGFYGGGTKSVNFSSTSTGALYFSSYTIADLTADGFLTNGTIQYNGAISGGTFVSTEYGGGVYVALTAVPEPSTYALLAVGAGTLLIYRRRVEA